MQIHELNDFVGSLNSSAYLAIDNGSDTGKISATGLLADVNNNIVQLDEDLNARIDNIIAGGDAPSEAEIVDARLGANGETYASLGDAIRGQVQNLTEDISIIGIAAKTFAQTANTAHASTDDRIYIYAKAGDDINILVSTDVDDALTGNLQYFAYYTDGTSERLSLTSNKNPTYTLTKDMKALGLYYPATGAVTSCNVTVAVKLLSASTLYGDYSQNKADIVSNKKILEDIRSFLLPLGTIITNSYVETTGVITAYNGWSRTDYVDISGLSEMIATSSNTSKYNCFYDENKIFISSFYSRTTGEKVIVPANAKYAIFSNSNAGMASLTVSYVTKFKNQDEIVENAFTGVYCETDINTKLLEYGNILSTAGESDNFLFFTDPHLFIGAQAGATGWLNYIYAKMPLIQKAYNSTPTSFCMCGGDWLSNNDTPEQAATKLGYVTGMMKHLFDRYYMIVGNHDTNYQGTERLTDKALTNLLFSEIGKMYYTFKNPFSRFYVFDTGIDWDHSMGAYRWEQIDWFANQLLTNDDTHSVICLHIITNQNQTDFEDSPTYHEMAQNVTALAEAYNDKTSITLNSITYDFSATTGTVEFAIAGHSHFDAITSLNNIPIMITDWVRDGSVPTFDLVLADYTNSIVKTVRIGAGSNRSMPMVSA